MASIDEFSAAIGAAVDSVGSVSASIGVAKQSGDELHGQLSLIGAEGSAARTSAVNDRLESDALAAAAQLKAVLEEIRGQAEALRS